MILEDLIFEPFGVFCPECGGRMEVEFEDLRLNREITCPQYHHRFFTNVNVDVLLKTISIIESTPRQKFANF